MLKIRNRIAILYSLLTIVLAIFCLLLFFIILKFNIYKKPILLGVEGQVDTISDQNNCNDEDEVLKESITISTEDDDYEVAGDTVSFTKGNLERIIVNNLNQRILMVIWIVIIIVIFFNFLLSKKYAAFALVPLSRFTKKVKNQKLNKIDLIELPKVKDEIYDLTVAYNEVLSKIKLSYEDMRRLNSYTSHELRNSLAVLRAKIEVGENSESTTKYIDKLSGTISDILAMSTASLSEEQQEVDLALICAKVVDEYSVVFKNIKFYMPDKGVETIKGMEVWIERCVINLVDNALKFIDKNKEQNEINISVFEDQYKVVIEVYDNGIGIDKDRFEKIFIPYYGSNKRTSTGIGLAYVKHVMNLHNGSVEIESNKGEYSKFSLIFKK